MTKLVKTIAYCFTLEDFRGGVALGALLGMILGLMAGAALAVGNGVR